MDINMVCHFLHQNNPYLKLGPMKYEMLNQEPEISLLHDFISFKETTKLKSAVQGKLMTTPYKEDGKEKKFTKSRLSKIKYLNEQLDDNARKISQKIEMATKFVLYKSIFDSENYQVMGLFYIFYKI